MTPRIHDIDDAERWAGEILPSVSRTFALSIRFLPGTLGRAVTTAYLLCRIADTIEKALKGALRLPEVMARRGPPKGRLKAFAIEPDVTINNQWSNRYTVIEVTGLDRPGLLYELTATLSKLSLNITSAHVATFGERVVDVFYVTDLLGAKISMPTRQTAIKRALLPLLSSTEAAAAKKAS